MSRTKFTGQTPILSVRNVPAGIAHYVDVLGFEKAWDWGDPPTFGCVTRDEVCLFLCEGAQGRPGTWLSVFVEDVDALHAEYVASGANVRQPPTNFPWGMREMNVEDLDGHRLRFGHVTEAPSDDVPLCED